MHKSRYIRSRITLLISAASLIVWSSQHAIAQRGPAAVVVDTVDKREIRDTQTVIGRLAATRRSDIATRIAGIVNSVVFKVGDRVAKGHTLIRLDSSRLAIEKRATEASVVAAEAGISVAQAKLKLAEQAFKRQADLKNSTAFSRSRFDDLKQSAVQSRSELREAEAKLQIAKVGLDRANYELTHTTIVAPFDSVVIARQAQPGQYMQAGGTVATLLDINDLEIAADVPGALAQELQPGAKIDATFRDGVVRQVAVRSVVPLENLSTRTRPVRFKIDDMTGIQIAVGSTVTLKVPVSAAKSVMTVPKDALLQGGKGWMVFVVKDGKAQPRPVVLGPPVRDRMTVMSGLIEGEVVVIRGNERLRPGQSVRPKHVGATKSNQG